jgi:Ca-activated chloride channel family protein
VDVLNDLDRTEDGALRLPNLVHGRTVEVLIRLEVLPGVHPGAELLRARLSFDDTAGNRQRCQAGLTLPIVSPEGFSGFSPHPEVLEQALLLDAARTKRRAIQAMDAGDRRGARSLLSRVLDRVDGAPKTDGTTQERAQLLRLLQTLDHGDVVSTRKLTHAQSYTRQRGRSDKKS